MVYLPDPATGMYTVVDNPALPCRLTLVSADTAKDSHERAELAGARRLLWGNGYAMPETARVVVSDLNGLIESPTWDLVAGTFAPVYGPGPAIQYHRAECVRVV